MMMRFMDLGGTLRLQVWIVSFAFVVGVMLVRT
jgi:hypothetical protein